MLVSCESCFAEEHCKDLKLGQLGPTEERWDNNTMWESREWKHFQSRKLATMMSINHCLCGDGCDECYGEPHCGCPLCYQPPKKKTAKMKLKQCQIEMLEDQFETPLLIPSLVYENCHPTISSSEKVFVNFKSQIKTKLCQESNLIRSPKKTKFFCTFCNVDICKGCVSSSCASHRVQYLGSSAKFSCSQCL